MLTADQIKSRLAFLDDYALSVGRNTWDDPDRVSDELVKIITTRAKLRAALRSIEYES